MTDLAAINYDIPQGSVLGSLLFLLYINNLNQAVKFLQSSPLFADDTNLSCLGNYQKTEKTSQYWLKASS